MGVTREVFALRDVRLIEFGWGCWREDFLAAVTRNPFRATGAEELAGSRIASDPPDTPPR